MNSQDADKEQILVVDDAELTLEMLQRNLLSCGYRIFTAPGVAEALGILESTPIDLVITDYKMPEANGLNLIRHIRENYKDTETMMITGYATIEGAVEAVKAGADEYLPKPFTDEELFSAVRKALNKLKMRIAAEDGSSIEPGSHYGLIGESKSMQKVFRAIAKVASTSATALITGDSGTGKELVARAIHYNSPRASAPFVPVNCGAIPENLLESELFGHIRGAFTGATEARAGFFQTAEKGTIFLDEVSNTSLPMQAKLLRVLQDKEVCMVGSDRSRRVDVRILAATNEDLQSMIRKKRFREDLYYRLNVILIDMPPLRERGEDIILLANHFKTKFINEFEKPGLKFSDNALQVIINYSWPGNVRELENLVRRLVLMTDGDIIDVPDFSPHMRFSVHRGMGVNRTLADIETEHIKNVLQSVDGNKTHAAEILGIDRKTLREKVKKYGLGSSS
ncbi:MAG: sigma-54 dependent transcriptional regulator [Candidatus Eremiobacteraeota bacterium]|nr:sigma-54 dependent transcriptional regulator [Candidatus Eremiobacteraeota bacterium]